MIRLLRTLLLFIAASAIVTLPVAAMADAPAIGIVIMHGKGGSPGKFVNGLASALAAKGYLVANLEMPWSGRRGYDASVAQAEQEVETALTGLKAKGAQKLFVAGHSQGAVFATYFAGRHPIDGLIAISPGGNTGSRMFREKLGASVAQARAAVAAGKGEQKMHFLDFEGRRGTTPVVATAANYLGWFDPEGAMNLVHSVLALKPSLPVLWIVAKHDYPALRRSDIPLYQRLAHNPLNALYEPDSDHLGSPSASIDEILRWTQAVAGALKP